MKVSSKRIIIWIAFTIVAVLAVPFIILVMDSCVETYSKFFHNNNNEVDSIAVCEAIDDCYPIVDLKDLSDTIMEYSRSTDLREMNPYDTLYSTGNSYEDLKQIIIKNNTSCPIFIGEGMAISSVKEEDEWITHYCVVDEDVWNFQGMSQDAHTKESMRSAMKDYMQSSSANDRLYRNTLQLYITNGKGIKYHYFGTKSHCSFDLDYSVSELNEIIK